MATKWDFLGQIGSPYESCDCFIKNDSDILPCSPKNLCQLSVVKITIKKKKKFLRHFRFEQSLCLLYPIIMLRFVAKIPLKDMKIICALREIRGWQLSSHGTSNHRTFMVSTGIEHPAMVHPAMVNTGIEHPAMVKSAIEMQPKNIQPWYTQPW